MRFYIGITNDEWFRFLSTRPEIDEVNFWQPSGSRTFRALSVGEPFLFKLHSPSNFIVGGGFFAHYSQPGRTRVGSFWGKGRCGVAS